jgi:hypothetical protein
MQQSVLVISLFALPDPGLLQDFLHRNGLFSKTLSISTSM